MASVAADMTFEIGCGIGEFAVGLLSVHANATLIETDQSMRKVDLRRKGGVDAPVADVMDLPFDEEQLDVVVAMWMPHHVPDLCRALGQVRRVLRRWPLRGRHPWRRAPGRSVGQSRRRPLITQSAIERPRCFWRRR